MNEATCWKRFYFVKSINKIGFRDVGGPLLQVQEFLSRFENIPDMLELDHLTVSGDVTFGKNVSLKVNENKRG